MITKKALYYENTISKDYETKKITVIPDKSRPRGHRSRSGHLDMKESSSSENDEFAYIYHSRENQPPITEENVIQYDEVKNMMVLGAKNTGRNFFETNQNRQDQRPG